LDHTAGAIFTIGPNQTGLRQVTHEPQDGVSTEPDWSPDGQWIAYMEEPHGDQQAARLYKIHPDGTNRTPLAQTCTGDCLADGFPAWSPSGRSIAFERTFQPTTDRQTAIFVMPDNGSSARQITQPGTSTGQLRDLAPTWSPDGSTIAFQRYDGTKVHNAIFTVRQDGTGLRQVTSWNLDAAQPDYSADGRWILFRSNETVDTEGNVWLVHPDGTGGHPITHAKAGTEKWLSGSFSPDGLHITNGAVPLEYGRQQNADVYVMNLDGSGLQNVTRTPDLWESAPAWGP
jgi:Tol biopolymer transport system component